MVRRSSADGRLLCDRVQLADEPVAGEALLQPCMVGGRRTDPGPLLEAARQRCAAQLRALPEALCSLAPASPPYPVEISDGLRGLAQAVDARAS